MLSIFLFICDNFDRSCNRSLEFYATSLLQEVSPLELVYTVTSLRRKKEIFSIFLRLSFCLCRVDKCVNRLKHKHKHWHKETAVFLVPAEIQENSVQSCSVSSCSFKMASESTHLYEKLAEAVRNYSCLYYKSSDNFKDANKKIFAGKMLQKRLVLVVVSRHRLAVLLNYCV